MKHSVYFVNAFVKDGEGGNLAGVVLEADLLNEQQMQHIAAQVGASETAFVLSDKKATHRFRFFTPTMEVPLCGHATVAAWWLMYRRGLHFAGSYLQNNLAGVVGITIEKDGKVFMEQPEQKLRDYVDPAEVASTLDIPISNLSKDLKPRIVQRQLLICLDTEEVLNRLQPQTKRLVEVSTKYDFYGFHVFVLLDNQASVATVRNFCPRVGIYEDAATGTANGALLEYLRHYNKLPSQKVYTTEQGKTMGSPSLLFGKFQRRRVWVGGLASLIKQEKISSLDT